MRKTLENTRVIQVCGKTGAIMRSRLIPYVEAKQIRSRSADDSGDCRDAQVPTSVAPIEKDGLYLVWGHALCHFGEATVKKYRLDRLDYMSSVFEWNHWTYRLYKSNPDYTLRLYDQDGKSFLPFCFGKTCGYSGVFVLSPIGKNLYLGHNCSPEDRLGQFQWTREHVCSPEQCLSNPIRAIYIQAATDLRALCYKEIFEETDDGELKTRVGINHDVGVFSSVDGPVTAKQVFARSFILRQIVPHVADILHAARHAAEDLEDVQFMFEATSAWGLGIAAGHPGHFRRIAESVDSNPIFQVEHWIDHGGQRRRNPFVSAVAKELNRRGELGTF